jgi:hypothetical protein
MSRVFFSWSGDLSHKVAIELSSWLQKVLQSAEPWVSSEDIGKGQAWLLEISSSLADAKYGIICVTPDNIQAPWLNFEAGALSHSLGRRVAPFLLGVEKGGFTGPLSIYQATSFDKEDVRLLVKSINEQLGDRQVPVDVWTASFESFWPRLESALQALLSQRNLPKPPVPENSELLKEIHESVNALSRMLTDPGSLVPERAIENAFRSAFSRIRDAQITMTSATEPVAAVTAARLSISGILNCSIQDSLDPREMDAFLAHRYNSRVRVRRIIIARSDGSNEEIVKSLSDQAREHENY